LINNPVLRKELMRGRIRQPKATLLAIAAAILALLGWFYFELVQNLLVNADASAGRDLWGKVIWIQFALVCLVAPSIAANAIAQEKEQQTWEMLLFTRLMPGEIILGKLLARMVFLSGIFLLGLPAAVICALHADRGGVGSDAYISAGQFAGAYVTLILCGLFFATFGLFMSWLLNRTLYAIIASYTFVVFGLILVTTIVGFLLSMLTSDLSFFNRCPLMWFNPFQLITWVTNPQQHLDTVYLIYGLVGYGLLSALMIWRMIAGFRRSPDEA
jgi:ABC-type transport system involved in multi-copper enzyme maturation permease subunit